MRGQRLSARADDRRLIAWDTLPGTSEFRNRPVLVTIGSDKVVPLSGSRSGGVTGGGRWTPLLAER
ncbi:hypothetical protein GCM10010358_37090 [Streptomyces minutiscleroticus]|uniref:Uncharacterized protein n=1 Tax=Streptomyces minutiscleroticus TaxID=68238 RepID=A0A918U1C8_9ACTN|nr:hypothetical protein [Streptomyces minutiscleroticus]GGX79387.1 hypothetical protein GCM10010358_37090 [Streptomyces minutiscleroticus]